MGTTMCGGAFFCISQALTYVGFGPMFYVMTIICEEGCLMTTSSSHNHPDAGWKLDNTYAGLPEAFHARQDPVPVRDPQLVVFNTVSSVSGSAGRAAAIACSRRQLTWDAASRA